MWFYHECWEINCSLQLEPAANFTGAYEKINMINKNPNPDKSSDLFNVAPPVGLEPTTTRLTAECSTD